MKYAFVTSLLIFLSVFTAQGQATKKVLFIGNSYTGVNNLPLLVQNIAIDMGDVLVYDSNTPGGYRLMNHATHTTTLNKINAQAWDYVVLQAQSQETSWSNVQMQTELYPYAATLSNAIRANNECTQPMFYMTWGRENGDSSNCGNAPWVCTYEGMDDAIKNTYNFMAAANEAEVAPVGAVWRYIRTHYPTIALYAGDGSHPSLEGSYAAACVFYTMIYKKDPLGINWNSSLSTLDADRIKMATKNIVFDQMPTWDFTVNPAKADYSEVVNGNQITFTNTSDDFDSLLWDFGDGNTSTDLHPIHSYGAVGDYNVSLTVYKCGKWDTMTKTISIAHLENKDALLEQIEIYPNPVMDKLIISLNSTYHHILLELYDLNGKLMLTTNHTQGKDLKADMSHLSSGIYLMKLSTEKHIFISKILKK